MFVGEVGIVGSVVSCWFSVLSWRGVQIGKNPGSKLWDDEGWIGGRQSIGAQVDGSFSSDEWELFVQLSVLSSRFSVVLGEVRCL
jgi:hypothetical protein